MNPSFALVPLCVQQWHSALLNAGAPWWIWYVIGGDTRCSTPTPSPQNVCVCVVPVCMNTEGHEFSLPYFHAQCCVMEPLTDCVEKDCAALRKSDAFYLPRDFIKFPFYLWWAQTRSPASSVSCFLTDCYVLHNILPPVWLQCFLLAGLRTFCLTSPAHSWIADYNHVCAVIE